METWPESKSRTGLSPNIDMYECLAVNEINTYPLDPPHAHRKSFFSAVAHRTGRVLPLIGRQSVILSNHRGDLDWLIGLMVGRVVKTVSLNMYRRHQETIA